MNHSMEIAQEYDTMNDTNDCSANQGNTPAAAPDAAPELRLALMGSEGSGKTSFFAGLAWLGRAMSDSGFGLVGRDEASQKFVTGLRDTLARGEVPPPTHDTSALALDVLHGGLRIAISTANSPGEEFMELQAEDPLFQRLLASQYMLLFLDIEKDVDGASKSVAERLDAALNLLTNERLCNGERKLGVLLTKSDLRGFTGENATSAAARTYLAGKQPAFLKKIEGLGYETEFFFLAPLGRSELDLEHPPVPFGYERLFGWIVKARKWQHLKEWCRKHATLLAGVAMLLVALLGASGYKAWKRNKAAKILTDSASSQAEVQQAVQEAPPATRDDRADQLVEDIVGRVASIDNFMNLDEEWAKLAVFDGHCSANVQGRIDDCKNTLKRRRETLHVKKIGDKAKLGSDFEKDCREAIGAYRDDIADGKSSHERAGDVDEIEKSLAKNKLDRLKAQIRAAVPERGKTHTLLDRCDLVDSFPFADYPELKEDQEDAKRAAAIGRRICDGQPFHLTMYKGNKWLKKPRRTRLEITILGKGLPPEKSRLEDSAEPQWETPISVSWMPGDKIRIQWVWDAPAWKGGFSTTVLAERTFEAPWTAILDILGGCELTDTGNANSVRAPRSGEPRVFVTCKDFKNPEKDLEVFKKFIYPGEYWK